MYPSNPEARISRRQPFEYETNDGKIAWIHNGETYNHEDIRNTEFKGEVLPSRSDCYVTGRLYAHNQRDFA